MALPWMFSCCVECICLVYRFNGEDMASKIDIPTPVVCLLFLPLFMFIFVFSPGFVVQHLVSFLVLLRQSSCRHVAVNILCLFLVVPGVGLQFVIMAFPVHTHFFSLIASYTFM